MKGRDLLNNPLLNRSTAFTLEERDRFGLRGLLPPQVETMEEQVTRVLGNCARKHNDLDRYIFLTGLMDQNETLFYRTILDNLRAYMPIIYTPTVGEAAKEYAHIFRRTRGLYVSAEDRGQIAEVLRNWPQEDVRVIVVTDGERILGLGDLGANGMSIPVGKLALYTAAGGIPPGRTLPILLDVGTDNESLRDDPPYLGLQAPRLTGEAYLSLVDEFVAAVREVFPNALLQFEDFATRNAYPLLARYRDQVCSFNDDIQGTAAVGLAGIWGALRITGQRFEDQKVLFLGSGSAATGIADLMVSGLVRGGMGVEEARLKCWFVNRGGLVVSSRTDLKPEVAAYAHDHPHVADLTEVVETLKPTALIGATGQPSTFTRPVLKAMAEFNERPIVFALSNPTSRAECTAEEAYAWTEGRAVFAGGSPFDPVVHDGRTLVPGQANNVYIFPGIGLAVVASGIQRVTDEMFLAAADAVAGSVSEASLEHGTIFPPLESIRDVSVAIAARVSRVAEDQGHLAGDLPSDLEAAIRKTMYEPVYAPV